MIKVEKGICDCCGHYSSQLMEDEFTGLWKCRKCEMATEKAVQEAYAERSKIFNGVAINYPYERIG